MNNVSDEIVALVRRLAKWTTCVEDEFEFTDDPYIDNTLADLDVVIRDARKLIARLDNE